MRYNSSVTTRSLYIHWPFCPYKCHFCPFVALASHDHFMERYHYALRSEIERFAQESRSNQDIDTVFIGGGTPSTYPNHLLLDMFATLRKCFGITPATEITIEVNPGTVKASQLEAWKNLSINRLSIGVQSLQDSVLHKLNRMQTATDVHRLMDQVKGRFNNVSVDLIIGLPGVAEDDWKKLVKAVVTWPIQHISMYFLSVHENTPLFFGIKKKKIVLPREGDIVDLYNWTVAFLHDHGFEQYEISSFAKKGHQCEHNKVYWEHKPYKGFGLGACSYDGTARFMNEKNIISYMTNSEQGASVQTFSELLTSEQIRLEKLMLALRRSEGLSPDELIAGLPEKKQKVVKQKIAWLKKKNLIYDRDGKLALTSAALAVENEIVVQLSV